MPKSSITSITLGEYRAFLTLVEENAGDDLAKQLAARLQTSVKRSNDIVEAIERAAKKLRVPRDRYCLGVLRELDLLQVSGLATEKRIRGRAINALEERILPWVTGSLNEPSKLHLFSFYSEEISQRFKKSDVTDMGLAFANNGGSPSAPGGEIRRYLATHADLRVLIPELTRNEVTPRLLTRIGKDRYQTFGMELYQITDRTAEQVVRLLEMLRMGDFVDKKMAEDLQLSMEPEPDIRTSFILAAQLLKRAGYKAEECVQIFNKQDEARDAIKEVFQPKGSLKAVPIDQEKHRDAANLLHSQFNDRVVKAVLRPYEPA